MDISSAIKPKVISIENAMDKLTSNHKIVTSMAAAEPVAFFQHLHKVARNHQGLSIQCANPTQAYPCFTDNDLLGHLRIEVMFLTSAIRHDQGHDRVHYIPQHLSQWVENIRRHEPVDIFWGTCSAPDARGLVSLGPSCCYESEILHDAKLVILEINPRLPFVLGAPVVHPSEVDFFVHSDHPLAELPYARPGPIDEQIAGHVASLIDDGSTIQLGIGHIPNAVAQALQTKKDLGIHTEMINDAMRLLFEKGVITGRKKSIWPGKIVGSFAFGSQDLYDFCAMNPVVELHPASVINDIYRIGRNHKMVSVNTAVEIDITGQVCSESVGHRELSGVGGATDTHMGAQRSPGGRGIVAIHSTGTTKAGKRYSKIVSELQPGAKVSIGRNDVDTVVTEYGAAFLRGYSVAERARALAQIAHPDFREELLETAKRNQYI